MPRKKRKKRAVDPSADEIADLLPDFGSGPKCRLAIYRARPEWCSGYIEAIEIYSPEDVSLEYLRDAYGGGTYYIKVKPTS
jgi:hypothetical protein